MGRRRDIIGVTDATGSDLAFGAVTVTATATAIPTTPMNNRKAISVRNWDSSNTVYIGTSTVTTATGYPLQPYESFPFDVSQGLALYGICDTGLTAEIRYVEINND